MARVKTVRLFERPDGTLSVLGEDAPWPRESRKLSPDRCAVCGRGGGHLYESVPAEGRLYHVEASWPRPRQDAERLLAMSRQEPDFHGNPHAAGMIVNARSRVLEFGQDGQPITEGATHG